MNRKLMIGVSIAMAVFTLNSCNKKIHFATSSVVPAARGYVKVKKDNNSNYNISVHISDLAEVNRLQGNAQAYVVWMSYNEGSPKNLGQIKSDTKRFSNKLRATFHTVSSIKPTAIFITAEQDAASPYPGSFQILSTEVR